MLRRSPIGESESVLGLCSLYRMLLTLRYWRKGKMLNLTLWNGLKKCVLILDLLDMFVLPL